LSRHDHAEIFELLLNEVIYNRIAGIDFVVSGKPRKFCIGDSLPSTSFGKRVPPLNDVAKTIVFRVRPTVTGKDQLSCPPVVGHRSSRER
jgi:hypothetical protein